MISPVLPKHKSYNAWRMRYNNYYMIEVKNLRKVYGKKDQAFTALNGITFHVKEGQSVAVIGKSGSGKSTLMHIMSGLDHPTAGSVMIGGEDISKMNQKTIDRFRAEKIGFIFQSFFVQANESCYHNVGLPLEVKRVSAAKRKNHIEAALKEVGLEDKIHQKARNLSGGQKQRLAIARAIVNDPKILFADEPTGNLDSTTGKMIEDLLFDINKQRGTTLIVVTHDDDLANRCDVQIYIKDGAIVDNAKGSEA